MVGQKTKMFLIAAALVMSGCKEGFEASEKLGGQNNGTSIGDDTGSGEQELPPVEPGVSEEEMKAINADIDAMEADMAAADKKLQTIDIAMLLSQSGNSSSQSLDKELRNVLQKLYDAIAKVYGHSGDLRKKVNEQLAKLDPTNPLHAIALFKLQGYLKYLDEVENKAAELVLKLAEKMDQVVFKVDEKIAAMDPSKFETFLVVGLWAPFKGVISEFHDNLVDLVNP